MKQLELIRAGEEVDPNCEMRQWLVDSTSAFERWQRVTAHSEGYLYSERSVRQHCAMWHRFSDYLADNGLDLSQSSPLRVARFLDSLRAKNGTDAEDSTRRRYLKLLETTFAHLIHIGVLKTQNPCTPLFKYYRPAAEKIPAALASDQDQHFVELILAQRPVSWRDIRDQAMIVLIIGSGLYASEITSLQLPQLMLNAQPPYIHIPAHGKVPERKAPIAPFAREALQRWVQIRAELPLPSNEKTVFVSGKGGRMLPATLYRKVQRTLAQTSLQAHGGRGPQVLRNSFLMRQLARKKPVTVVQQWAGHVETKSTLRFRSLVVNPGGIEAE